MYKFQVISALNSSELNACYDLYMQIPLEIIAIKLAYRALSPTQIEQLLTEVVSGEFLSLNQLTL
jgi:hypothetical protein